MLCSVVEAFSQLFPFVVVALSGSGCNFVPPVAPAQLKPREIYWVLSLISILS